MRAAAHLLAVVGLYAAIQTGWFLTIPPFEGPDEIQHYDHVRFVAVTGHLPDTPPTMINDGGYFTGEWTQEGAYYWMLGLVLRQTGFQDTRPGDTLIQNRHCMWYGGTAATVFAHGDPLPPHVAGGLLVGRVASVLFGLGTLLSVFAAIRLVTRDDRIATLAASCVALVPQFGAQHVFITNDTPVTLWASLASALVVWFLTPRQPSSPAAARTGLWLAAAIGAATGLAIATKLTAAAIVFAFPLALWLRRREIAWRPQAIAWVAGMLATAGIGFGRNWIVFGDPLATMMKKAVVTQFGFRAIFKPGELASYADLVKMLFRGMWASIGWAAWTPQVVWLEVLFAALTAFLLICLAVSIRLVLRRLATRAPGDDPLMVMLAIFLLHCAAFVVSISIFAGYSARYFLPFVVPFIVVAVMGAQRLFAAMRRRFGSDALQWTLVGLVLTLCLVWIGTFTATIAAFHFEGALR